jgi:hypothetical protein
MGSRFSLPFANVGSGLAPSDGAKLFFFESGTSTDQDTFSDEDLTPGQENANPVIADENGVFPDIWVPDGQRYKVVLKDKDLVQLWEADPVSAGINSQSLESIAALRADSIPSVDDFNVEVLGYYTAGDEGGGGFYWDAASTSADDNGVTILPTGHTGPGRWKRILEDNLSVRFFGATGDGVTDDSAAWIAADAFVLINGGGKVSIPSDGVWFLNNDVDASSNVAFIREGEPPLIRNIGELSSKPTFNGMVYMGVGVTFTLKEAASIKGVTFWNNALTMPVADISLYAGTAIFIDGFSGGPVAAHEVKIDQVNILGFAKAIDCSSDNTERMWITNVKGDNLAGIRLNEVRDRSFVQNCHFWPFLTQHNAAVDSDYRPGIAYDMDGSIDWIQVEDCFSFHYQIGYKTLDGSTVSFLHCQNDADTDDTVNVTGQGFVVAGDVFRVRITDCTSFAKKEPYYIDSTFGDTLNPTRIENCTTWFNVPGGKIVTVNDGNVAVSNCNFSNWDYAIWRQADAGFVFVIGNTFTDINVAVMGQDAAVVDGDRWIVGDNAYLGNTAIAATGTEAPLFPSVASASTLLIPDFAEVITVTGTVTLDNIDFTAAPMGRSFTLLIVNGLTLDSGGNITPVGGGTRAVAAGASIIMYRDSTGYREVGTDTALAGVVTLTGTQTITGLKDFTQNVVTSADLGCVNIAVTGNAIVGGQVGHADPTDSTHSVNVQYADANYVSLATAQTITGAKTLSALLTLNNDFIMTGDQQIFGTLITSLGAIFGTGAHSNTNMTSTLAPTLASHLTRKDWVDANFVNVFTAQTIAGVKTFSDPVIVTEQNNGKGFELQDASDTQPAPMIYTEGRRNSASAFAQFAGKVALAGIRTDAAVAVNKTLGVMAFGGNHTTGGDGNLLYGATIAGVADGAFNSAADMPTALVFSTGIAGFDLSGSAKGTEAMRIASDGFVGIGVTAPSTELDLLGDFTLTGDLLIFGATISTKGALYGEGVHSDLNMTSTLSPTVISHLTRKDYVDAGDVSDIRLKTVLNESIGSVRDGIMNLDVFTFQYNEGVASHNGHHIVRYGTAADQWKANFPHVVHHLSTDRNDDGSSKSGEFYMGLDAGSQISVLTKGLQEAFTVIDELKARIDQLENS